MKENAPKKVVVKFEEEIEHCYQCPFKCRVCEHGYNVYDCTKLGAYMTIPNKGIRPDCPFREK